MRKIVQIAFEVSGSVDTSWNRDRDNYDVDGSTTSELHALCNDESIWFWRDEKWNLWISEPIPQTPLPNSGKESENE